MNDPRTLHAQKMEAVGRLAGGVAHDFNNLLTAIQGYTEIALRHLDPLDPLRQDLGEVRKCAERASALTRQLLAFSRQQVLHMKVLDLNAAVMEMEKLARRLIGEDVKLVLNLDPAVARIKADASQLEQVLMNLVVNARDAMPRGGTFTMETSNVVVGEREAEELIGIKPGRYVLLALSDTGEGMDENTRKHAFEPFFTTKSAGSGTGLGLSTVYGIVKQSGGYIYVDSAPGEGTRFRIFLPPTMEEKERPIAPLERPAPKRGTETVLLVEDEESIRDFTRRVLSRHGYKVLDAAGPGEALLTCEKHPSSIHLMLSDVVMPQMGGGELALRVISLHPETKILYMTGYKDPAVVQREIQPRSGRLVLKPFRPDELLTKVRDLLDGQ